MRLIDADAYMEKVCTYKETGCGCCVHQGYCPVDEPTVEAKEVVHGYVKTVVGKMGVMHQECSACGNVLEWKAYPNYCDECGAKLDGADMQTSAE